MSHEGASMQVQESGGNSFDLPVLGSTRPRKQGPEGTPRLRRCDPHRHVRSAAIRDARSCEAHAVLWSPSRAGLLIQMLLLGGVCHCIANDGGRIAISRSPCDTV